MAEITVTIPDDKVQRVREAFAVLREKDVSEIGLADVKAYIINDLKGLVVSVEKRQFNQSFVEEDLGVS